MTLRQSIGLVAAALWLVATPALQAQPAAPPPAAVPAADKAYFDLYDAVLNGFDMNALGDKAASDIYDALIRNRPEFAERLKDKPGIRDRFVQLCRPYFAIWLPRSIAVARSRTVTELKSALTPLEARQMAAFYTSGVGRKMIKVMGNNLDFDTILDTEIRGGNEQQSKQAFQTDINRSAHKGVGELLETLNPAERDEFIAFARSPLFRKVPAMNAAIARVKQPTQEDVSTPEERQDFTNAVIQFMTDELRPG